MLSRRDRVVLDTLLPPGADPVLRYGVFDSGFDSFHEEFQRTAIFPLRLGLRLALFTASWISPLLIAKLPPLSRHGRDVRERALEILSHSNVYLLRQTVLVLKAVASFGYGADVKVRDAVEFPLQHDDPRARQRGAKV